MKQSKIRFVPGKATHISEVSGILANDFRQAAKPIRDQANKLFSHAISVETMLDDGAELTVSVGDLFLKLAVHLSDSTYSKFPEIKGSFGKCQREAKALFNSSYFKDKEFGHDFSIVAMRLGVFAQVLQTLEDNMMKVGASPNSKVNVQPGGELEGLFNNPKNRRNSTEKKQTKFDQKPTLAGLKKVKKRAQTMFLGARKLARISPFKGTVKEKYTKVADKLNEITDFQMELTAEKTKLFDIASGKANLGLTVIQKDKNRFDSIIESAFGRNMNKEFTTGTENNMKDYFLNKVDIGDIQGGPESLNNKITKDLGLMLGGKTPKKTGNTSKTQITKEKLIPRGKKNQTKIKASRAKAGADYAKRALAVAAIRRKADRKESGNSSEFRALSELRTKIQARLPARVRKNMGPPALTNRTSRFSNSVTLKQLHRTAKGISGEYTYMLSPYETFENTGARKWKTGYNPKPLIAKSIKELALEMAGERFLGGRRK